jgi:hypothetical protein
MFIYPYEQVYWCTNDNKRKCERQQLRVSVNRKAAEDVTSRPAKLIRTELQSSDNQSIP